MTALLTYFAINSVTLLLTIVVFALSDSYSESDDEQNVMNVSWLFLKGVVLLSIAALITGLILAI